MGIVRSRTSREVVMTIKDPDNPVESGLLKAAIKIVSRTLGADPAVDPSEIVLDGKDYLLISPSFGTSATYDWKVLDTGQGYTGGAAVVSGDDGEIYTLSNIQPLDTFSVVLQVTTNAGHQVSATFVWFSDAAGRVFNAVNAVPDGGVLTHLELIDATVVDTNTAAGGITAIDQLGADVGPTGTYGITSSPPNIQVFVSTGTHFVTYSVTDTTTGNPLGHYGTVGIKVAQPAA